MNTDIDFMKIAEGDKAFVTEFENFVNGKVSSTEKTGMAMTTMHRSATAGFQSHAWLYEGSCTQLSQRSLR